MAPGDYAACLLRFRGRGRASKTSELSTFNVAFLRTGSKGRAALELRLLALADRRRTDSGRILFAALCGLLTAGMILAAASVRNPGDWSQDRLTLSTVVNLERLEAINRGY